MENNPVISKQPREWIQNQWFIMLLSIRGFSWNCTSIFASLFAGLLFMMALSIRGFSWNYTTFATSLLKSFSYCYQYGAFLEIVHQSSPHYLRGFYLWWRYQFGAFHEITQLSPHRYWNHFHIAINTGYFMKCTSIWVLIICGAFIFDDAINSGLFMKMPSNSHTVKCGAFHIAINSGLFLKCASIFASIFTGFYFWWRYQFGAFHENDIKSPHH